MLYLTLFLIAVLGAIGCYPPLIVLALVGLLAMMFPIVLGLLVFIVAAVAIFNHLRKR